MRGDPRYIDALPSTMITTSQNAGMYAPPAADGPNRRQICGTWPESCTSLKKIRPAWRLPGEHVDLVGDPRAGRVDEVEERDADPRRGLLDPDDLLDRPRAPAAGFHRRVVRHHGHLAAVDACPGPVTTPSAGQLVGEDVGEEAVFDE